VSEFNANDNIASPGSNTACLAGADGRAALLLVESLIHLLIARSIIRVEDALEIVSVAMDAQKELDADPRDPPAQLSAATLIEAIGASIAYDLPSSTIRD
jgi:hypothetical protein